MKGTFWIMSLTLFGLAGCSTMNSHFTCNVTAGDSCLTIEEVDAMTRFTDGVRLSESEKEPRPHPPIQGYMTQTGKGQNLWLAKNFKEHSWG